MYVSSYRVCFQLSSDAYPFVCYLSTRTPHEPYGGVHGTLETQRIVYQAQWRGVHEQRRRRAASCIDILPGSRYPQHYDFVYLESEMAEKAFNVYFPASTLPPPDLMGPYPTDRKQGLVLAAQAKTVEEALARRAAGGAMPASYIPSYKTRETS